MTAERVDHISISPQISRLPDTHPTSTPEQDKRLYLIAYQPLNEKPQQHALVEVNMKDRHDRLASLFRFQALNVKDLIDNPEQISVPRTNAQGRTRSSRERRDIRKTKLEELEFTYAVLEGRIMAPITITVDENDSFNYYITR